VARTDDKVGYPRKSKLEPPDDHQCTPEEASQALRLLEGKWKMFIIFRLFEKPELRFSELERRIPGITQKMLIQQLRDLENVGIVRRKVYPEVPPKVEYSLTPSGRKLYPVLDELLRWWKQNVTSQGSPFPQP
jgi:DNA-binding HxlR family transcriptional regulator